MNTINIAFVSFKAENVDSAAIINLHSSDTAAASIDAIARRIGKIQDEGCSSVIITYGQCETGKYNFPINEKGISAIAERVYRSATA